jgi:alpha-ketoglutarate-dependent taurine dioxygenase
MAESSTVQATSACDTAGQRAALEEHGYLLLRPQNAPNKFIEGLGRLSQPTLLRSMDREVARRWSLSGTFGQDAFPWHTDGAISSEPPRWLVLRPIDLSEPTTTELLSPCPELRERLQRTVLLAKDHVGRARYLPALMLTKDGHRIRWDPRTCRPRSTLTAQDIAAAIPDFIVKWELGDTLLIDNYKLMHRRPAVNATVTRTLERTYVWGERCGITIA